MARSVDEACSICLGWITPSSTERSKASSHRASIEAKLEARFGLWRMYETGSWNHGTGVSGSSDIDYFVSLKTDKTIYGSTILNQVKAAMEERFTSTPIFVRQPAVVLNFGAGYERVELIPVFPDRKLDGGHMRYDIPGVRDEWIRSAPEAHLAYVNAVNARDGVKGGAEESARLAKSWKYRCDVPISSFYAEMRAAQYMSGETGLVYDIDLKRFLESLWKHGLADMNDPTGSTGRVRPCSSDANHAAALSKLHTAMTRAQKAVAARDSNPAAAFGGWDYVFGGKFPAYY